jgi:hypothetical protein
MNDMAATPRFSAGQIQAAVEALSAYREPSFVAYEWEELVARLSRSEDRTLRERMRREIDIIRERDPLCARHLDT